MKLELQASQVGFLLYASIPSIPAKRRRNVWCWPLLARGRTTLRRSNVQTKDNPAVIDGEGFEPLGFFRWKRKRLEEFLTCGLRQHGLILDKR